MSNDYDNNGTIDSDDISYIITNWNENFELSDIFNINSQLSDFKIAELNLKSQCNAITNESECNSQDNCVYNTTTECTIRPDVQDDNGDIASTCIGLSSSQINCEGDTNCQFNDNNRCEPTQSALYSSRCVNGYVYDETINLCKKTCSIPDMTNYDTSGLTLLTSGTITINKNNFSDINDQIALINQNQSIRCNTGYSNRNQGGVSISLCENDGDPLIINNPCEESTCNNNIPSNHNEIGSSNLNYNSFNVQLECPDGYYGNPTTQVCPEPFSDFIVENECLPVNDISSCSSGFEFLPFHNGQCLDQDGNTSDLLSDGSCPSNSTKVSPQNNRCSPTEGFSCITSGITEPLLIGDSCSSLRQCASNEYISMQPTPDSTGLYTQDRECENLTDCSIDTTTNKLQKVLTEPTDTSDRVCEILPYDNNKYILNIEDSLGIDSTENIPISFTLTETDFTDCGTDKYSLTHDKLGADWNTQDQAYGACIPSSSDSDSVVITLCSDKTRDECNSDSDCTYIDYRVDLVNKIDSNLSSTNNYVNISDIYCANLSLCTNDQYVLQPPTTNTNGLKISDRTCSDLTTCDDRTEYERSPPTESPSGVSDVDRYNDNRICLPKVCSLPTVNRDNYNLNYFSDDEVSVEALMNLSNGEITCNNNYNYYSIINESESESCHINCYPFIENSDQCSSCSFNNRDSPTLSVTRSGQTSTTNIHITDCNDPDMTSGDPVYQPFNIEGCYSTQELDEYDLSTDTTGSNIKGFGIRSEPGYIQGGIKYKRNVIFVNLKKDTLNSGLYEYVISKEFLSLTNLRGAFFIKDITVDDSEDSYLDINVDTRIEHNDQFLHQETDDYLLSVLAADKKSMLHTDERIPNIHTSNISRVKKIITSPNQISYNSYCYLNVDNRNIDECSSFGYSGDPQQDYYTFEIGEFFIPENEHRRETDITFILKIILNNEFIASLEVLNGKIKLCTDLSGNKKVEPFCPNTQWNNNGTCQDLSDLTCSDIESPQYSYDILQYITDRSCCSSYQVDRESGIMRPQILDDNNQCVTVSSRPNVNIVEPCSDLQAYPDGSLINSYTHDDGTIYYSTVENLTCSDCSTNEYINELVCSPRTQESDCESTQFLQSGGDPTNNNHCADKGYIDVDCSDDSQCLSPLVCDDNSVCATQTCLNVTDFITRNILYDLTCNSIDNEAECNNSFVIERGYNSAKKCSFINDRCGVLYYDQDNTQPAQCYTSIKINSTFVFSDNITNADIIISIIKQQFLLPDSVSDIKAAIDNSITGNNISQDQIYSILDTSEVSIITRDGNSVEYEIEIYYYNESISNIVNYETQLAVCSFLNTNDTIINIANRFSSDNIYEVVTGMCSSNTNPSEDVDCGTGQRLKDNSNTITGNSANECCEDIPGMCSGNTNPSEDFDCGIGQRLKDNSDTITGNTATECCEDITGMCSGNKNPSENVDCITPGYHNKPDNFNIVGDSVDDCCSARCSVDRICGAPNLQSDSNILCSGLECTDTECCYDPSGRFGENYWIKGNQGESCNTVCSANSMSCTEAPSNTRSFYQWVGIPDVRGSNHVKNYIAENTYGSGTNLLVPLDICRDGRSISLSSAGSPSIRSQTCYMPSEMEGHRFAACHYQRPDYEMICRCYG